MIAAQRAEGGPSWRSHWRTGLRGKEGSQPVVKGGFVRARQLVRSSCTVKGAARQGPDMLGTQPCNGSCC
jgi:hypothetical protein